MRAEGWEIAEVFVDNDLSAFGGKRRPGYERLMEVVSGRGVGAVVAWADDRLHRSPRELEDFIDAIEASGAVVATVRAGDYDFTTAQGRANARQAGVWARLESERKSERLRLKHEELAESGRYKGGPRPYGYRSVGDGRLEVVAEEKQVVQEAAARLLAGETLYGICDDFNRRALPTARGAAWRMPTLRRILTAPATAAKREHRGEVVGDATWEPLLDELTWWRLRRRLLTGRSRARVSRSYLLTGGMARCGRCGSALRAHRKQSGARQLICIRPPGGSGCGRLAVGADPLDALVTETVLTILDTPAVARLLSAPANQTEPDVEEIGALEAELYELAEAAGRGEISRGEWLAFRRGIESRIEAARQALARHDGGEALAAYVGPGIRQAWEEWTLDQRRACIAAGFDRVVVHPASRRGRRFDPARVELLDRQGISWRFTPGDDEHPLTLWAEDGMSHIPLYLPPAESAVEEPPQGWAARYREVLEKSD